MSRTTIQPAAVVVARTECEEVAKTLSALLDRCLIECEVHRLILDAPKAEPDDHSAFTLVVPTRQADEARSAIRFLIRAGELAGEANIRLTENARCPDVWPPDDWFCQCNACGRRHPLTSIPPPRSRCPRCRLNRLVFRHPEQISAHRRRLRSGWFAFAILVAWLWAINTATQCSLI